MNLRSLPIIAVTLCFTVIYPALIAAADNQSRLKLSDVLKNSRSQKLALPVSEQRRFDQFFNVPIVADLANRRMFVRDKQGLTVYKMAIGRPASKIPYGRTEITLKRRRPTWTPTPEARKRNPFLPKNMIASTANPLGSRALNLKWQYYLIHGTNDHEKIGRSATWGCMSLAEEDVLEVFSNSRKGQVVEVFKNVIFDLGSLDKVGLPSIDISVPAAKPSFIRKLSVATTPTLDEIQSKIIEVRGAR